ncbi:hypothetical protein PHMEG_00036858 [Phytophthora megakarya]|uniref:Uncharacterized protein n=1 Tax=Phytophthora megakarya TaxID=4795 RepID=A0A225UKY1_9STRA|nr:hypothetical protein PHMEG_00036858 [Phytophthora megakarya]
MVLFLSTIQNRTVRKRGRKRREGNENSGGRDATFTLITSDSPVIGHSTLAAYVNRITDLWRLQHSLGSNVRVPVRPNTAKEILKQKKVTAVQRKAETFQDAGEKTMVDATFSDNTVQKIVDEMFNSGSEEGLRSRADILLSLGLSSRRDNIRRLCLPHIGLIVYSSEGVCGASLLRTVWRK